MEHTALAQLMGIINEPQYDHYQDLTPDIPISAKLEDSRIYVASLRKDAAAFTTFNIDAIAIATNMEQRIEALSSASIMHETEGEHASSAKIIWETHKDEITQLRDELLPLLTYIAVVRDIPELRKKIAQISQGTGYKDAIVDLGLCANLAAQYDTDLAERNYNTDKVKRLAEVFAIVSDAYPLMLLARETDASQQLRNRAFWYLTESIDHLKKVLLPMVFWNDRSWRSRYASRFHRRRRN